MIETRIVSGRMAAFTSSITYEPISPGREVANFSAHLFHLLARSEDGFVLDL
jgi:hypothetical protein